jgi:uncharacterized membrane protein HdeD (DUF308 family)
MRFVAGFARFWWDFIVGDDWRIAAGVVLVLAGGALLVSATSASATVVAALTAAGIMLVAIGSIVTAALRARRS